MENMRFKNSGLLGQDDEDGITVWDILLITLMVVMIILSLIKIFWLVPVHVSGRSMNNTIQDGNWLFVDKMQEPTYGDIIVVRIEEKDEYYIKRVIGLGGDTVRIEDGKVYLKKKGETESVELKEDYVYYINPKSGTYCETYTTWETTVPEGKVFFMGDNRQNSTDSRVIGARKVEDILGTVPNWAVKYRELYGKYYDFTEKANKFINEKISDITNSFKSRRKSWKTL